MTGGMTMGMGQIFSWLMTFWILYSAARLYDEWCDKSKTYIAAFWIGYFFVLVLPFLFFNLAGYFYLPWWSMLLVGWLFFAGLIPLLWAMTFSRDTRRRLGLPLNGIAPDHPVLLGLLLLGFVTGLGWWLWFS